jgi:hypothetical protein
VATAVSLDPSPARKATGRRALPWKPIGILSAAVVLGSVLSLCTRSSGHSEPSSVAAVQAPAATTPAGLPAATTPTASALPLTAQPRQQEQAQGCAPGTPALEPDVVLSVGAPAPTLPSAQAVAAAAPTAAADASRKAKPKVKRKAQPTADEGGEAEPRARAQDERPAAPQARTEDERPAKPRARADSEREREPEPRTDDAPVSGETIVVPDEEPRKRSTRRARADREDGGDREARIDL